MFLSLTSSHNFIFSTWIPETRIRFGKLLPGAMRLGSEWRMPSRAHPLVLVCPRCSPPKRNDCHLVCLILDLAWGLVRAEKAGKSPEVNGDFLSWLDDVYEWQPTPVFLPGESHGWRSLVDYSPWGHKDTDTTDATQNTAHKQVSLNLEMFWKTRVSPYLLPRWKTGMLVWVDMKGQVSQWILTYQWTVLVSSRPLSLIITV